MYDHNNGSLESRAMFAMWEILQNKCLQHLPSSSAVGYARWLSFGQWDLSKMSCGSLWEASLGYNICEVLVFLQAHCLSSRRCYLDHWVMLDRMMKNKEIEFLISWDTISTLDHLPIYLFEGNLKFYFVYATSSFHIPHADFFTQPNLLVSNTCSWRSARKNYIFG